MNRKTFTSIERIMALLGLSVLIVGCGYGFVGSGGPPKGLNTIFFYKEIHKRISLSIKLCFP